MKKLMTFIFVIVFGMGTAFAANQQANPRTMLQQISNKMIAGLKANQAKLKKDPQIVVNLVKKYIEPHIDVTRMVGSILGRNDWLSASTAQKRALEKQVTNMVVRTYADAFANYNGDRIGFYPLRGTPTSITDVRSVILRPSGQKIPVTYYLALEQGKWMLYDFAIENVSIVQTYQSQFAPVLQQSGVAGLIQDLKKHNG